MDNISVHIFDRDPAPTGLIRYGMAPDHQKIKRVGDELLSIMKEPSCKFFGGIEIVIDNLNIFIL
jgi:NADPH-dependent glutamate synthase beta subunit-like oxidoreductase